MAYGELRARDEFRKDAAEIYDDVPRGDEPATVAAHLTDDGSFVVEAFMPTFLTRLRGDRYGDAETIGVNEV